MVLRLAATDNAAMPPLTALGRNGWTGGQASLVRIALGLVLLAVWSAWLLALVPREATPSGFHADYFGWTWGSWRLPLVVGCMLVLLVAAARFVLGAAGPIGHVLLMGFVAMAALAGASLDLVAGAVAVWALAVHAAMPRAPILSLPARGRVDPGGGWRLPAPLFALAWIGFGTVATLAALTLPWPPDAPVDRIAHAALPLAWLGLHPRARPGAWLVVSAALALLTARHGHPLAACGVAAALLVLADPAWIAPRRRDDDPLVLYDGGCGLCHGFVRLLLAEDVDARLRFAPLHGRAFTARVPEARREGLPDSIVLATADGALRVRSDAVLELLARLGGAWRVLATLARPIPAPLRDLAYDGIARVRKRLFAPPPAACPILPTELAARFEA